VGCGTGNYIAAVRSAVDCACWGIDPSSEMLAEASEKKVDVTFQAGSAERLEFATGFFDLVFSVSVVHHLESITDYFQEVQRVLKPGGRACTVTDTEWIIRHRIPLAQYFPETVDVDLRRYPSPGQLCEAMSAAGLSKLKEQQVELQYQLTDAKAYQDKAFSSLHLIGEEAWRRGLERLEEDLRSRPIACVSRYVVLWGNKRAESLSS